MTAAAILALDPGKTTGWATFVNGEFASGQDQFDENCARVANFAYTHGEAALVVSESFIITVNTAKNTQAPWSLELIGVYRYLTRTYTGRDIVLQTPAQAKGFSSDGRLRAMGWYVPGQGHANDAARHLLVAMAQRKLLDNETLRSLIA